MKTLEVVVKKRNELRNELQYFETQRREIFYGRQFAELDVNEKREHMYIVGVISRLKVQIDALTYVINYDSELDDVTIRRTMTTMKEE